VNGNICRKISLNMEWKRRRLKEWEEVSGVVKDVKTDVVVLDNFGEVEVDDKEFLKKMKKHIGEQIAILKTDLKGKEYCWRVIN